jgi:ParB-like chromosome segregation protein Spo0J
MNIIAMKQQHAETLIQQISMEKIDVPPGQGKVGNFTPFVFSIQKLSLLQPIVVTRKGSRDPLLDGRRRYYACTRLGWPAIPAIILPVDDQLAELIKIDMHLIREEMTPRERDALRRRRREICRKTPPAVDSPSIERTSRAISQLIGRLFGI